MRGRNVPFPAQYASAADDRRCSTLTNGKLYQIWSSPAAERHHFYCLLFAARNPSRFFDFFDFFRFFDSKSNNKQLLNISSSTDIIIPVDAQYGQSKAPELTFTSDSLCRYRCIAAAQYWTCGEGILGSSRWSLPYGIARWNAGNERPDWSIMYIDVVLNSCRISCATRTLPCWRGR